MHEAQFTHAPRTAFAASVVTTFMVGRPMINIGTTWAFQKIQEALEARENSRRT
jgi:hypothetical protein